MQGLVLVDKNGKDLVDPETKNGKIGEKYETFNNLGRFSMRYEGSTIAIGKIMKVKPYKKEDTK